MSDKTAQITGNRLALPSLIFAVGLSGLEQPLREAHKVGIPIIAVVDSDCNPCLLYTSPSPRDLSTSRMPSSA